MNLFFLMKMTYWKTIILLGIKLMLILKKNLIARLFRIKNFLKTNIKFYVDEVPGIYVKEIPKENLDPNCLARISLD